MRMRGLLLWVASLRRGGRWGSWLVTYLLDGAWLAVGFVCGGGWLMSLSDHFCSLPYVDKHWVLAR